jgi:hypothetical protein
LNPVYARRLGLRDTRWRIGAMVDQGDLGTSDLARRLAVG